jgi:hypothetical protein
LFIQIDAFAKPNVIVAGEAIPKCISFGMLTRMKFGVPNASIGIVPQEKGFSRYKTLAFESENSLLKATMNSFVEKSLLSDRWPQKVSSD